MSQHTSETSRCKSHTRCTCAQWRECCICAERAAGEGVSDRAQAEAPDGLQLDLGVLEGDDEYSTGR